MTPPPKGVERGLDPEHILAQRSRIESEFLPYTRRANEEMRRVLSDFNREHPTSRFPSTRTFRANERLVRRGKRYRYLIAAAGHAALSRDGGFEPVARAALWLEFYHAYTLFLDDIMDEDERRRGYETGWAANARLTKSSRTNRREGVFRTAAIRYGASMAILDALRLRSLAERSILTSRLDAATQGRLLAELVDVDLTLSDGQGLDIDFERAFVSEAGYEGMSYRKTGRLYEAAAVTGVLAADGGQRAMRALRDYALHFAWAFQDRDDMLGSGLVASYARRAPSRATSDIRRGKRTHLFAIAWDRATSAERHVLEHGYGTSSRAGSVTAILRRRAEAPMQERIHRNVELALRSLRALPARREGPRRVLEDLARLQLVRDR